MSKVAMGFCTECLGVEFLKDLVNQTMKCTECWSETYFEAHTPREVYEEVRELHENFRLEYGPLLLVYAAAGLAELYYIDSEPEAYSREDVFERIAEGVRGDEGYSYNAKDFLKITDFIENSGEGIDGKRLRELRAIIPRLKKTILVSIL